MADFNVRDFVLCVVLIISVLNLLALSCVHTSVRILTEKVDTFYEKIGSDVEVFFSFFLIIFAFIIMLLIYHAYAIAKLREGVAEVKLVQQHNIVTENSVDGVLASSLHGNSIAADGDVGNPTENATGEDAMGLELLFAATDQSVDVANVAQSTDATDGTVPPDDAQQPPVIDAEKKRKIYRCQRRLISSDDNGSDCSDRVKLVKKKHRRTSGSDELLQNRWSEEIHAIGDVGNVETVSDDSTDRRAEAGSDCTDLESIDNCNVNVPPYGYGSDEDSDSSDVATIDDSNRNSSTLKIQLRFGVSTEDADNDNEFVEQNGHWIDDEYFVTDYRGRTKAHGNSQRESTRRGRNDLHRLSDDDEDYETEAESDEQVARRETRTSANEVVEDGRWEGCDVRLSAHQSLDRGDTNKDQDDIMRRLKRLRCLINSVVTDSRTFDQLPVFAANHLQQASKEMEELISIWRRFCGDAAAGPCSRDEFRRHVIDDTQQPMTPAQVTASPSGKETGWIDNAINDSREMHWRARQVFPDQAQHLPGRWAPTMLSSQ